MIHQISESIKGLQLGVPFSKLAATTSSESGSSFKSSTSGTGLASSNDYRTTRTDSSFSNDATLRKSMENHNIQPLYHSRNKDVDPEQVTTFTADTKKSNKMSKLVDRRILRPNRQTRIGYRRNIDDVISLQNLV